MNGRSTLHFLQGSNKNSWHELALTLRKQTQAERRGGRKALSLAAVLSVARSVANRTITYLNFQAEEASSFRN
jgi:hypothetical protein